MISAEKKIRTQGKGARSDRKAVRITATALTILFGSTAAINIGAFIASISPLPNTHLAAMAMSLYLMLEARLYLNKSDSLGLISPALLALVMHFYLSYLVGITATAFEPYVLMRHEFLLSDIDGELVKTMFLAFVAVFFMLRGYSLARPLARVLRRSFERMPSVRRELGFNLTFMVGLQLIYLFFVAYAISVGAYGLQSTAVTRAQNVEIQQLLNLALAAGTLSYFLLLLRHFERRTQNKAGAFAALLVIVMIVLHVVLGSLSAFKFQVILPFVILALAHFISTGRIYLRYVAFMVLALLMSYAVIEPYRSHLGTLSQPSSSILDAINSLTTAISLRDQFSHGDDITQAEAIAQRFDLAGMTALAVNYVDEGRLTVEERRRFQDSILLAPLLAYLPRIIWQDKPSYAEGVWFNQQVRGRYLDGVTSVGMGPIGYLYMTGGFSMVILGFALFGILQALVFEGIGRSKVGGLIIYFSVAATLTTIPTSFGPAVTGVLRMLPVAFVTQWIFLRR